MKIFLIITFSLLVLIIFSCKDKISRESIIGAWSLENVINTTGDSILDKTTFFKPDSVLLEVFVNGKIETRFAGTYKISGDNKHPALMVDTFPTIKFEILSISKKQMELQLSGRKHIDRYKRI